MSGIVLTANPACPDCGGRMRLRRPRPSQTWKPFWGCMNYPDCKGSLNIDPETGEPEDDRMDCKLEPIDSSE
jgi:ssDNA-binding Zn-finger/Zn-ribbon topoisomerase 1